MSVLLPEQRRVIRHLLDERSAVDAMAAYFAFYHADAKTTLRPYPTSAPRAVGYVCLSRTGMDLFRPLITMRLPIADVETSSAIMAQALEPGVPVILNVAEKYLPLIEALFDISTEEKLMLMMLDYTRFEPVTNVLITQDMGANGLPRFLIRNRAADDLLIAGSGLNWQSPHFAEISVTTHPQYRRRGYGRSVVASMANYLLANGRTPLYVVAENNAASILLAQRVGFTDTGHRIYLLQATYSPPHIGNR